MNLKLALYLSFNVLFELQPLSIYIYILETLTDTMVQIDGDCMHTNTVVYNTRRVVWRDDLSFWITKPFFTQFPIDKSDSIMWHSKPGIN